MKSLVTIKKKTRLISIESQPKKVVVVVVVVVVFVVGLVVLVVLVHVSHRKPIFSQNKVRTIAHYSRDGVSHCNTPFHRSNSLHNQSLYSNDITKINV